MRKTYDAQTRNGTDFEATVKQKNASNPQLSPKSFGLQFAACLHFDIYFLDIVVKHAS